MDPATHDAQLRQAAFSHVNRLATLRGSILDAADLASGFEFGGDRIPLINPQRGIFKPWQMEHLLSVKTVFPRRGARVWYDEKGSSGRWSNSHDGVRIVPIATGWPYGSRNSRKPLRFESHLE